MSTSFIRTIRSLKTDGFRRSLALLVCVLAMLSAWAAWFLLAKVPRYEVTDTARLEVGQAMHLVQAPMVGRIVASRLVLDAKVEAGDVLVELDAEPERLQIQEQRARLAALDPQIRALDAEIAAAEQGRVRERDAADVALDEARARLREAEVLSHYADGEATRLDRLQREGLVPQRDLDLGKSEAARRRAAADSLRPVAGRLEREQRTRDTDREAHLKRLLGEITQIQGQKAPLVATIGRLEYEIERRRVRAPVGGRLGEVAVLRPGAVVAEGEKLGAIVPFGALRVVAEFPPEAALGRIHPGQLARLRLHGFPWAQYGSIPAAVSSVGSEVRLGVIRVELAVRPGASPSLPLQHGLPGSVEVEVERLTPATLILRAAGNLVASPKAASK